MPTPQKKNSEISDNESLAAWFDMGAKLMAKDCSENDLVSHVYTLAEQIGVPEKHLLKGIGPNRSQRIIFQKRNVIFYLTTDSSPADFFRKKLVTEEVDAATIVVTNGRDFFLVKNEVALDGGNFDWGSLSKSDKGATLDLFSSIFSGQSKAQSRSSLRKGAQSSAPAPVVQKLNKIVDAVERKSNEEQVKKDFVFSLCQIAGWQVNPVDGNDSKTSVEVERYQPQKGRLDLLLKDDGVPRIVIECKKPAVTVVRNGMITDDGRKAMEQAHRYATGVRFWRQKRLPNIMSMVTNGKQAIWFDSTAQTFEDALKTAQFVEITKDTIVSVFQSINLQRVRDTDLSYICNTRTIYDEKKIIETSSTHILATETRKWLAEIRKSAKNITKEDALAMTLQILFLTIARDHGILGSEEIDNAVEQSNWDGLFKRCLKRFNSNVFEKQRPKDLKPEVLDALYEKAQRLPFSLEAIPVEYVGDIYESLLHDLHSDEKHLSKTSYFTPQWLVKEIVEELKPTKNEKVIDPTCGSAAFLCYTFDYVTKDMDFEQAREYLSKNIFGVDRDQLAVQVSRFALLVDLARKVDGDWKEREHILPKLTEHIIPCDFFKYETKDRYDLALGNPPWGSIDKEVRDKSVKAGLKIYKSYKDKTDICIYVVERAFDLLSKRGRLGFLVQRQTLDGVQHSVFREWWNDRIEKVWDFEADELFAPRNKALTAVLLGRATGAGSPTKIVKRGDGLATSAPVYEIVGKSIDELFEVVQGAQAGCNPVFQRYAEDHPDDEYVRSLVIPEVVTHGTILNDSKALFIHPDTPDKDIPSRIKGWLDSTILEKAKRGKKVVLKKSCAWWLKNRAEVVRKSESKNATGNRNSHTLGWLWLNGAEHYKWDAGQKRIVFSYYLNGPRLAAGLDKNGSMVPLTSCMVLIPKADTTDGDVYFTLGWLNSVWFARTEAQSKGKLSANGGRAINNHYLLKMLVPTVSDKSRKDVVSLMKACPKSGLSESDLSKLDSIFESELKKSKQKKAA